MNSKDKKPLFFNANLGLRAQGRHIPLVFVALYTSLCFQEPQRLPGCKHLRTPGCSDSMMRGQDHCGSRAARTSSFFGKVGSISAPCSQHIEVSLGKILDPELPLILHHQSINICEQ